MIIKNLQKKWRIFKWNATGITRPMQRDLWRYAWKDFVKNKRNTIDFVCGCIRLALMHDCPHNHGRKRELLMWALKYSTIDLFTGYYHKQAVQREFEEAYDYDWELDY